MRNCRICKKLKRSGDMVGDIWMCTDCIEEANDVKPDERK